MRFFRRMASAANLARIERQLLGVIERLPQNAAESIKRGLHRSYQLLDNHQVTAQCSPTSNVAPM